MTADLPAAFWEALEDELSPAELTPHLQEAFAEDLSVVQRGDVELVKNTITRASVVVDRGLERVRRVRAAAAELRDALAVDGSHPVDVRPITAGEPIGFLRREAHAVEQLSGALNQVLFGIGGCQRRDLDALISTCDRVLECFRGHELRRHRRGARTDDVRQWLVHQAARHLEEHGLLGFPIDTSNDGILARVTRVMLAAADRLEGVRIRRRNYLTRHLDRWLETYQALRIPNSVTIS